VRDGTVSSARGAARGSDGAWPPRSSPEPAGRSAWRRGAPPPPRHRDARPPRTGRGRAAAGAQRPWPEV